MTSVRFLLTTARLTLRQVPMMLRSFFRQGNQVFWNYGFFLLAQFFACSVLVGDATELRPLLGCAVILLTVMAGGLYGVSNGLWNFFGGAVVERYRRSRYRTSAILAYLVSRFLIIYTAVLLQFASLYVFYDVRLFRSMPAFLAALALVVIFGGGMVLRTELEVGVLVAFALYIQRFFDPVRRLTMQYTAVQRAVTSASRVFDLMDTKPEVQDRPNALKLPRISGEVRFENVSFHYIEEMEILHNINLHIKPGEHVALVGATGSGKTTLVSLLLRLYDVSEGRITVDGHDIRDVERHSLVEQMSMVLQEPFLFSGTIADDIRYSHTEVPDDRIERVARIVGAHGFISHLPDGYDTQVEERGQNLSPGQRQLISLARALVADPRIVILDEATASVDSYTERQIQQALERLLEGRTAIIIAHRLSTVRDADRIVVMENGSIVEEGRHLGLLAKDGVYARLHHALTVNGE